VAGALKPGSFPFPASVLTLLPDFAAAPLPRGFLVTG
jgi:hypothetical protein